MMTKEHEEKTVLGILGGLGPLASAEFLRTIYEYSQHELEQDSPVVLLHSDPTFPDRTEALLAGQHEPLLVRLTDAVNRLLDAGATKVVLCCMTIHYLVPMLPESLRERIISLVDVTFAQLLENQRRHLLLCSSGTLKLQIFQRHPDWQRVSPYVVLPTESDQQRIHQDIIYLIKKNADLRMLCTLLESIFERYEVDAFVAGCSEIHLLARHLTGNGERRISCTYIDPLTVIAQELAAEYRRRAQLPERV